MDKSWRFVQSHIVLSQYVTKTIFEAAKLSTKSFLYTICSILLLLIMMSVLLPLLAIFYIYKNIVSQILYFKIGPKFISLITGNALLCSLTDEVGSIICSVSYIESDRVCEELFKEIREKIWENFTQPTAQRNLMSLRKRFMSYLYFEEMENVEKSKLFECVKLDVGEDLKNSIQYYCIGKRLPHGGNFNWDVTLLNSPEMGENGKKKYVLIVRMHHFVLDGLSMYNLMQIILMPPDEREDYGKKISGKHATTKRKEKPKQLTKLSTFTAPIKISNSPPSNLKPHFNFYLEPTKSSIPKLREINKIFPATSFIQLILTAYSASLANYFLHNTPKNIPIPETLNVVAPMQLDMEKFSTCMSGQAKLDKIDNEFSMFNFYLPIVPKHKRGVPIEDYMIERMEMFNKEFSKIKNSMDPLFNYVIATTYIEVVPLMIGQLLMKYGHYNALTTIFPGGSQRRLFNGDLVTDNFFILPLHSERINANLCGLTYDDRLQFAQVGDSGMFESKEEFNNVLPNIFKFLDILYEDCKKYK